MTREQVETEMAQYRTIFTVVRLLDAAQVGGEESINSFCSCYSYWGKNATTPAILANVSVKSITRLRVNI